MGSSHFITNLEGEIAEHLEYVPFGGVFIEERNGSFSTPYLYNGKELDSETGYYYYGARYYNPRVSQWLSVDPLAEKYPSWSPYAYTFNNPIRFVDPTGLEGTDWVRLQSGQTIYDSRVTNQAEAEKAYGKGVEYRPVGFSYTASTNGSKYQLGDHGFYMKDGTDLGLSPDYVDYSKDRSGDILKQGVELMAATMIASGGPENLAGDVVTVEEGLIYATAALIAKMTYEMTKIKKKPDGPNGYQYALIANTSGEYPIYTLGSSIPTGSMHLNAGDVWKYGETTSTGRYTDDYKRGIGAGGVTEVPQVYGTQRQIKMAEKVKLYRYFFQNGHLPPGNKIFR